MGPQKVKIIENRQEASGIFRMAVDAQECIADHCAGQFFMVRAGKGHDPLLRRPLGLLKKESGPGGEARLFFLYQVRGKGTRLLSRLIPGDETDLIGPLGNGWRLDPGNSNIVAVAGGMGIVPLYAALVEVSGWGDSLQTSLVYGARTASELVLVDEIKATAGEVRVCTEDGCMGEKGLAPEIFGRLIREKCLPKPLVLACGPRPMLKKVRDICVQEDLECRVSMEARMGCGMGACLTCTVPGSSGKNLRVCCEGPVFDAGEIDWEALGESP